MGYLRQFLDATDPSASLKHLAFAAVVVSTIGWLTYALVTKGIDVNWVAVYGLLTTSVTTAKILGSKDAGEIKNAGG